MHHVMRLANGCGQRGHRVGVARAPCASGRVLAPPRSAPASCSCLATNDRGGAEGILRRTRRTNLGVRAREEQFPGWVKPRADFRPFFTALSFWKIWVKTYISCACQCVPRRICVQQMWSLTPSMWTRTAFSVVYRGFGEEFGIQRVHRNIKIPDLGSRQNRGQCRVDASNTSCNMHGILLIVQPC